MTPPAPTFAGLMVEAIYEAVFLVEFLIEVQRAAALVI